MVTLFSSRNVQLHLEMANDYNIVTKLAKGNDQN